MSRLIVTGVTGNAGSAILTQALASPQVEHVTTLSRRPPYDMTSSSGLSSIIIPSDECPRGFDELSPTLIQRLKAEGHTGVIWALGISQTQVNKEQYIQITHDYTLSAARAFQQLGTPEKPFSFVYISGEGADQAEKSWTFFGKIKGRTEKALNEMSSESFKTVCLRPAMILMTEEHLNRSGIMSRWGLTAAYWLSRTLVPSMTISSLDLGSVAVGLAAGIAGWNRRTTEGWIDNKTMLEMVRNIHG